MSSAESGVSDDEVVDQGSTKKKPSGSKRSLGGKTAATSSKKAKTGGDTVVNDEGVEMHDLGSKRYVSVSMFKGKRLIGIREYYEKDGKLLPGKKGISLTQDQYNNLKKIIPIIDEAIQS